MGEAETYQCPNCNGIIEFNPSVGKPYCKYCGTAFDPDNISKPIPIDSKHGHSSKPDHVDTIEDFLSRTRWEASSDDFDNAMIYSCSACGARIVADQSVVATSCTYCGNNVLVSGMAAKENIPMAIIPFAITQDQAEARLKEHFRRKWYLSRKFKASLKHIQAIYVPYHLYDIHVAGHADYICYQTLDTQVPLKLYYVRHRAGHASFHNVPVDGSSKMPDGHMDAISPFDFTEARPFSTAYVAGHIMEVPDEDARTCYPKAREMARSSFKNALEVDASQGMDGIDEGATVTDARCHGVSSCVLPVYVLHCKWNDVNMLFAVNGQTGKCVGDLPISNKRRFSILTATMLGLIAIAMLIIGFDNVLHMLLAIICIAWLTFGLDRGLKSQMNTAVESRDAGYSFDDMGLVVTERANLRTSHGKAKSILEKCKNDEGISEKTTPDTRNPEVVSSPASGMGE